MSFIVYKRLQYVNNQESFSSFDVSLILLFYVINIFSYDLDPDDGYDGRVVLPYESYYVKQDDKSNSAKPTWKPFHNAYKFKPREPANTLDPYETAVTTHDTHQHLTETTPIQPIRNNTTPWNVPINYANVISSSSSKPLTEVLQNMNRTSLQLLLTKLKENNYLPKTFTMNKLDNSLRTLAKVLVDLKKSQKPTKNHLYLSTTPAFAMNYPVKVETIKNEYEDEDGDDVNDDDNDDDVKSIQSPKYDEGKHLCVKCE